MDVETGAVERGGAGSEGDGIHAGKPLPDAKGGMDVEGADHGSGAGTGGSRGSEPGTGTSTGAEPPIESSDGDVADDAPDAGTSTGADDNAADDAGAGIGEDAADGENDGGGDSDANKPDGSVAGGPARSLRGRLAGFARRHKGDCAAAGASLAVTIAIVAAAGASAHGLAEARARLDASAAAMEARVSDATAAFATGNTVKAAISRDEVADAEAYDAMVEAIGQAEAAARGGESPAWAPAGGAPLEDLERMTRENDAASEGLAEATEAIYGDVSAVRASYHDKRLSDAKSELEGAVSEGQSAIDSTQGTLDDAKYRAALSERIASAQAVLDAGGDDVSAYTGEVEPLQAATSDVNESHERYEAALKAAQEEAARKAAAEARSYSGGSITQNSDGSWNVTYTNDYGAAAGAADGSVTQWADGYYIAHRSVGTNGKKIAALGPGSTVVVDGVTYVYDGEMYANVGDDADYALSWARQGGGIGFQTCTGVGNGVVIKRMVPVG